MFEKFSDSARMALFYARSEAGRTGSPHIGSEHLLLGLLEGTLGGVSEILARCKVSTPELGADAEAQAQRGGTPLSDEILLHESCKQAFRFAVHEANELRHGHVGAEHLLLGLLRLEGSTTGTILREHGLQLDEVRQHVVDIVPGGAAP